jgi:hypothetical protein
LLRFSKLEVLVMVKTVKTALLVAALALPLFATAGSAQQNADAIRAQCLAQVAAQYPGSDPARDMQGSARMAAYVSCMQKHGLRP